MSTTGRTPDRAPDDGQTIRVLLADDHAVVRGGLARLLQVQAAYLTKTFSPEVLGGTIRECVARPSASPIVTWETADNDRNRHVGV